MDQILDFLQLKQRWKMFVICFLATFLMTALPYFGVRIKKVTLANPIPQIQDIFDSLKPKLEKTTNNYKLTKPKNIIAPAAASQSDYDQSAAYGVVELESGNVIAEKNLDKKLPIASLTKLMSAVVALDLASQGQALQVSQAAASVQPTRMGLIPGQKWSLKELLTALLLTSANDSAQTIKENIDQSYNSAVFVRAMNAKAKFIGLKNSSFDNPQGFDGQNNYSTINDLAVLTAYALKNYPLISEIVKKDYQFFPESKTHKQADLYNWNGLMGVYPGVKGVKIGNTDNAKYTTIVLSQREDKQILAILLGAPSVLERDLWASQLLDLGFKQAYNLDPVNISEPILKQKYTTWKYFQ